MYSIQNYTTYSILSGTMEPYKWVDRAAELGYKALGICDKQSLAGIIEFQDECKRVGIKPIFGMEVNMVDHVGLKKDSKQRGHLLLYAKDQIGLVNLIYLNNFSHDSQRGKYYRPYLDIDTILKNKDGILCIVPHNGFMTEFKTLALAEYLKLSHALKEDFYIGINPLNKGPMHDEFCSFPFQKVLTFDCHTPTEDVSHIYPIVRQIVKGQSKKISDNFDRELSKFWLPHLDDLPKDKITQECIRNLDKIYQEVDVDIPVGEYYMPHIDYDEPTMELEILKMLGDGFKVKLCPQATFDKLVDIDQLNEYGHLKPFEHLNKGESPDDLQPISVYIEQLKKEFEVIKDMGFLDYFLAVKSICSFADSQVEGRGPARGSAAGSLFSYLLNITRLDPIRHGLLFERFLNKDRNDLPDIDLDFATGLRDKIREYLSSKYGANKIIQIGSFDRYKISGAVKAYARGFSYGIPDNNGEIIVYDPSSLDAIFANQFITQTARGDDELEERLDSKEFKEFYKNHSDWFDNVIMHLLETIAGKSVHAAGTLILPDDIDSCVPVFNSGGTVTTQWRDRHCEKRGYPKFDILSIESIDVIDYAKKMIFERHGVTIPEYEEIPLDDELAMSVFNTAMTDGIFQFKSYAQHHYLKRLKPTEFGELVAATALVRPGPMSANAHELFVDIKLGNHNAEFEHPDMVNITGWTKGLIIYQEQMMRVCIDIAGFSPSEADYVRKACGKKKIEEMVVWEAEFIERSVSRGYTREIAESLWSKIVAFAEYGFNIAHSVSYVLIGYYQAWIKARYPVEFWAATLQYAKRDKNKYESLYNLKERAEREGISFIYPSIFGFASIFKPVNSKEIYWPLDTICGTKALETLCEGGRDFFDSISQMYEEVTYKGSPVNKGVWDKLISVGFFDPICKPWEAAEIYYSLYNKDKTKSQVKQIPYELSHTNEFKWYKNKNEAFGMIVEPWKTVAPFHKKVRTYTTDRFESIPDGARVFVGGYVDDIRIKQIVSGRNKGKYWAKLILTDQDEKYRVMCWSDFWEDISLDKTDNRPERGQLIELIGKKGSWYSPDGKVYHQVLVDKGSYVRVVWDEDE